MNDDDRELKDAVKHIENITFQARRAILGKEPQDCKQFSFDDILIEANSEETSERFDNHVIECEICQENIGSVFQMQVAMLRLKNETL